MKVLKVKDKRVAKSLSDRLLKKGLVVAYAEREEDLKKAFSKKAHVVLLVSESVSETLN